MSKCKRMLSAFLKVFCLGLNSRKRTNTSQRTHVKQIKSERLFSQLVNKPLLRWVRQIQNLNLSTNYYDSLLKNSLNMFSDFILFNTRWAVTGRYKCATGFSLHICFVFTNLYPTRHLYNSSPASGDRFVKIIMFAILQSSPNCVLNQVTQLCRHGCVWTKIAIPTTLSNFILMTNYTIQYVCIEDRRLTNKKILCKFFHLTISCQSYRHIVNNPEEKLILFIIYYLF